MRDWPAFLGEIMLDIGAIKTRDPELLNNTIEEILGDANIQYAIYNVQALFDCIEKLNISPHIFYDNDMKMWVFTNCYDEYLVSQDFFNRYNFVVVEKDINLALARGIHYTYHKRLRD